MKLDPAMITVLASIVAGMIGTSVTNGVKQMLGVDGKAAVAVASIVSIVLAAVVSFVNGAFSGVTLDLPGFIGASSIVFATATLIFKAFMSDKDGNEVDVVKYEEVE
jgi:hypothetical protein